MKNLFRSFLLLFLILSTGDVVLATAPGCWEFSLEVVSDTFIVGEPIWAVMVLENTSDNSLPRAGFSGAFFLDGRERPCRPVLGVAWTTPAPAPTDETNGEGGSTSRSPVILEPSGSLHQIRLDLRQQCRKLGFDGEPTGGHTVCYRCQDCGRLCTNVACGSFVVTTPKGIDKVAYDALGPNVVADSMRWGQLLQRFPNSTYAAYVVWKRYAEGTASVNAEKEAESTQRGPINEWGPGSCDLEGRIDGSQSQRFSGRKYVLCRSNWMELALDHHPNIWFADEIRLRLALDRFQLDDKAACASKLEDLSAHAKPYVAEKARALLEAMQAKNMLPGGPKDLTATPAKTEPEGKTDQ